MDQRINMDELDGARRGFNLIFRQAQRPRGSEYQCWAYALPASQHTVAHGLMQTAGHHRWLWEPRGERALHADLPRVELGAKSLAAGLLAVGVLSCGNGAIHAAHPYDASQPRGCVGLAIRPLDVRYGHRCNGLARAIVARA